MTEGARHARPRTHPCPAGRRPGRSVRARHHLSAGLGDGPLRFPLRLLHGGGHDVPAQGRSAQPRGARPAVQRLHRQGRAQAAAHRRRAAGAARDHDAGRLAVAPSRDRRARRAHAHHQRLAARRNMPPSLPATASSASTSRSIRSIPTSSAPSPAGASSTRSMAGIDAAQAAGLQVKINAVALKGVNEDELGDLVAWAHGRGMDLTIIEVMPLGDVGDGRLDQYLPLSLVRARLCRALHARRDRLPHRRAGALRHGSRRPADGSASSRRSPTISANPATGCASPAPARSTCAWARRTPPTCARRCARRRRQRPARRRHRRGDLAQAQGPRFHHRPPPPAPGAGAPHERDRRVAPSTVFGSSS